MIVYRKDYSASQPKPACMYTRKDGEGKIIYTCFGDEARGGVSAHGFWKRGRTTVFEIRATITDAKLYGNTNSGKVLESAARTKKKK